MRLASLRAFSDYRLLRALLFSRVGERTATTPFTDISFRLFVHVAE